MMYANRIGKKFNFFLSQNWSAPTIMTLLLCSMMILIHSFESIGILNGNRNLEHKIKIFSEKNKEENLEKQRKMMIESALEQDFMEEMLDSNSNDSGYTDNIQDEKANFFDF